MRSLQRYSLYASVFVTGASILTIEIVAFRLLSPYFGNTIFTASSVIGTTLAALALGYYWGGRLSDRVPSTRLFFGVILAGGLSVLALQILNVYFLPHVAYRLSIVTGPLFLSPVLFFLPALLLGVLSPFAITLQKSRTPSSGIGTISGKIFFWSTLGSILGSLLTGFVLIAQFGINQILIGVGLLLTSLGLVGLLRGKAGKHISFVVLLLILTGMRTFVSAPQGDISSRVLYERDGIYEKIGVWDDVDDGRTVRHLSQDLSNSGAMFLDADDLVMEYTKYYALYKLFDGKMRNVLFIGGGAYSVPKLLLRELQNANIDVAEIEPSLFEIAHKYFNLPESPRLNNYAADGRRLLHDSTKTYDFIFSDAYYSLYSIPAHLTTREFFQLAHSRMSDEGVFIAAIIGSLAPTKESFVFSQIKTFRLVFPNSYFFAVESPTSHNLQNIILVGYKSDRVVSFDDLETFDAESSILSTLDEKRIDIGKYDLSAYPILTDNYAPVEYLTARMIRERIRNQKILYE